MASSKAVLSTSEEKQNPDTRPVATVHSDPPQSLLLVLSDEEDYHSIRRIVKQIGWTVHRCRTVKEAAAFLAEQPVLAVITDKYPANDDWRKALVRASHSPCSPKLIFAYRFRETQAALRLLRSGVYQILAKPFRAAEVIQTLGFAWAVSKREWRRRGAGSPSSHQPE